jgi:hypothetical protein
MQKQFFDALSSPTQLTHTHFAKIKWRKTLHTHAKFTKLIKSLKKVLERLI